MEGPIQVFASYASEDKHLWQELKYHLIPLQRQNIITLYGSHDLSEAGSVWRQTLDSHLNSAQLILLLISPYYLASDFLYRYEMARALERQRAGETLVIPILLSPVHWQDEPFGRLNPLPENLRPITLWRKKSLAFLQVATGIRSAISRISNQTRL